MNSITKVIYKLKIKKPYEEASKYRIISHKCFPRSLTSLATWKGFCSNRFINKSPIRSSIGKTLWKIKLIKKVLA